MTDLTGRVTPAPPPPCTLNLAWVADLGNGDEAAYDEHTARTTGARWPMRALYEVTPDGATLRHRDPIVYPAGTL